VIFKETGHIKTTLVDSLSQRYWKQHHSKKT